MINWWQVGGGLCLGLALVLGLEMSLLWQRQRRLGAGVYGGLLLVSLLLAAASFAVGDCDGRLAVSPVAERSFTAVFWPRATDVPDGPLPAPAVSVSGAVGLEADGERGGESVSRETAVGPPARLRIAALDLDKAIVTIPLQGQQWDVSQLGADVGWLASTGTHPDDTWAMVFAGHMTFPTTATLEQGAFARLQYLTYGTEVIYEADGVAYTYVVQEISRVPPEAVDQLYVADGDSLLLVTCTDWHPSHRLYENRLIVRAVRATAAEG